MTTFLIILGALIYLWIGRYIGGICAALSGEKGVKIFWTWLFLWPLLVITYITVSPILLALKELRKLWRKSRIRRVFK